MRHLLILFTLLLAGFASAADFVKIDIPTESRINKIYFYNDQMGWAVTSGGEILSSFDGGETWRLMDVCKRKIRDIDFYNRDGYLVGDRGLLMKSTNGGATWQDKSLNMKFNLVGVGIVDDSTIITVGTDQNSMSKAKGEIFESRDYGKTWKKHPYRYGNGYTDIVVGPPRKVYVLAIKKVSHSISKGLRYFHGKYEGSRLAFGFDFMDDWGFMVGHKGYFARTTTHGKKWEEVDLGIEKKLLAVDMFDKYSGVAVGEDGLIVSFYDSGDRHVVENCGSDINLRTVCVTGKKIFIGGDKGLFMSRERFPRAKTE